MHLPDGILSNANVHFPLLVLAFQAPNKLSSLAFLFTGRARRLGDARPRHLSNANKHSPPLVLASQAPNKPSPRAFPSFQIRHRPGRARRLGQARPRQLSNANKHSPPLVLASQAPNKTLLTCLPLLLGTASTWSSAPPRASLTPSSAAMMRSVARSRFSRGAPRTTR